MITLAEIRGQERAVGMLRRALDTGRVAHAYLFCGPEGSGKHTTGLALAAALNCLDAPGRGCGHCEACDKIGGDRHPDVQTLVREGAAQIIPIQTVRQRVIPQLAMPPHEGRARVFLIEEATALQSAAANAFLKTLEEPPPRTHFIFGTSAPQKLLPTIRSRCQRVTFAALPPDLEAQLHGDADGAERLAAQVDLLLAALDAPASRAGEALHRAGAEVGASRAEVAPALRLLAERLHGDARRAALENQLDRATARSAQISVVLDTELAITLHNAHAQMAIEAMLHRLRRAAAP